MGLPFAAAERRAHQLDAVLLRVVYRVVLHHVVWRRCGGSCLRRSWLFSLLRSNKQWVSGDGLGNEGYGCSESAEDRRAAKFRPQRRYEHAVNCAPNANRAVPGLKLLLVSYCPLDRRPRTPTTRRAKRKRKSPKRHYGPRPPPRPGRVAPPHHRRRVEVASKGMVQLPSYGGMKVRTGTEPGPSRPT